MTNTYDTYKDSNVAWLDKVPINWSIEKGKHVLRVLSKPVQETDEVITCFRDGEVILRSERRTDGFTMSDKEIGYQHIDKGDLVIHGMDGFAGSMGISKSNGKGSPVLIVCNPIKDNPDYLMYYLRILASTNVFLALSTGIRERSCDLKWNKISVLPFSIPTVQEQKSIASFLDTKCAEIDSLISLQENMISELQAYKQSLITQAVTKGLDPTAKMKNSGVEWIGEIPEAWSISPMKYLISEYKAGPFGSALITGNLLPEGNILVYTPEHVAHSSCDIPNNLYLQEERREEMSQFFVHKNDVVFPIVGSLGRAMLIKSNMPEGIINQRLSKFKVNQEKVDLDYFMWIFGKSKFYSTYIELYSRGSFIVNLTKVIIENMPFPLPPLEEQKRISNYIDYKTQQVDSLITIKQVKIQELKDYKKSVIYEYVTGKKRV